MNEKQLTSLLKELDGGLKIEEYLRVLYLLKAWKILSIKIDDDRLKFEYFYKEKLGIEQFHNIIIDLKFINQVNELKNLSVAEDKKVGAIIANHKTGHQ
jgi:hypothetical protein